jgi:hypothetical protein
MEILSFALGMLTIVAVALVVVIVVGIVKVFKQQSDIRSTQEWLSNHEQNVNNQFREFQGTVSRQENDLYKSIGESRRDLYEAVDNKYTDAISTANAYTDSRLDKLEQKLSGTLGTKQVIKG